MMNDFTLASDRENNLFRQRYCRNEQTRLSIAKYFKVDVEGYEALAPGQQIYGWVNGGKLIGDAVIAFRAKDMREMKLYYPVFPEAVGKKLLRAWKLPTPPKWSVYAADNKPMLQSDADKLNKEMRRLLIYCRLFINSQQRVFCPMPYGFKEIYFQLTAFPGNSVDVSVVDMVNQVLCRHLQTEGAFTSCQNLQDFITYFHNKYTLLPLLSADFSSLRKLLKQEGLRCYF